MRLIMFVTRSALLFAAFALVCVPVWSQQPGATPTSAGSQTANAAAEKPAKHERLLAEVQLLRAEVERLKKKIAKLESERSADSIETRLTQAEQRATGLQQQLLEIAEKDATLQTRADQINEQLQPENINSVVGPMGTLHPERAREALARRLKNEKQQVQTQRDLIAHSRTRLEGSLASADAEVQHLKARRAESLQP
jgi:uncharacterized protein YydD (DUF2326 family)